MNTKIPQAPVNTPPSSRRHVIRSALLSLVLIGTAVAALLNRQQIIDQLVVWNFEPTTELQAVVERTKLSETGTFYLYASETKIVGSDVFNDACGSLQNEKTVVIGCYRMPEQRIFVYKVADDRLDGVTETSAVHEMLHAAFDRLSGAEKTRLGELLRAEEKKITDERLLSLIKYYNESEPTEVVNELHSIFGTEVRALSPELEAHYARYFTNRQAVIDLKDSYEQTFTELRTKQASLVTELNSLAADIEAKQRTYDTRLSQLNTDIQTFNTWAKSQSATLAEFTVRRTRLQTNIDALEYERTTINNAIDTYNSKKAELDALNLQAEELYKSINSTLAPTPNL